MKNKKNIVRIPNPIDHLYERLMALLGEPVVGDNYADFIRDIGNVPFEVEVGLDPQSTQDFDYTFPELGIAILIREGIIDSIHIRMFTFAREPSCARPYQGNLPAEIELADNRNVVEQKLGLVPVKSHVITRRRTGPPDWRQVYDLPSCRISFHFDGPTGTIQLVSLRQKKASN